MRARPRQSPRARRRRLFGETIRFLRVARARPVALAPRSIATQLVLLFTLCAALLLSCGLGVFYWIVVRHAFEEDNAVLVDKLVAIQADLKQPDGINAVDRELKNRRVGEPAVYWIRVI